MKDELEKFRALEKKGQLDKTGKEKKAQLEKLYSQVQEFRKVGLVIFFPFLFLFF